GALFVPSPFAFAQKARKAADTAASATDSAHGNLEGITVEQMKAYLTFIASDEMEGRNTPSRGLDLTAKFIEAMLMRWKLKPAGDNGTFFQKINLSRDKVDAEKSKVEINGKVYDFGESFLAQSVSGKASGQVVYVGSGWVIPSKNINAYQVGESKIDVKDKIIVALSGLPKDVLANDLANGKQGVDWDNALSYGAKNGARAVIFVPSPQVLRAWSRLRNNIVRGNALRVVEGNLQGFNIPTITASENLLKALFEGEKESGENILAKSKTAPAEPFELSPNKKVTINVIAESERSTTQNVVAILEGSDPQLKNEYVAIGAHYDHVGNSQQNGCQPVNGDSICNGADDDGSGTTGVLAIAEAFANGPRPKRSILFVWHAGEEKGLWGSDYFTSHPTVPLKQIVTQLNIDMIGRSRKAGDNSSANAGLTGPEEIYVIGSKMMSTELGELSESVNNSYLKLKFNYKYDDPRDTERLFFRSDHFNYAKNGIPIIFYFDGIHEDYHKPTDEISKIDFEKMERVARTVMATAWALANRAERVKVDKKLPPELSQR
ncbi:MAG TPA: M28 family peptidase, partial [Blastocatellia bacterium]|nr:M28 family peptidase [Blastocatellia bacterium]